MKYKKKQHSNQGSAHEADSIIRRMHECIDIHTHIVPENFPPYAGKGKDVPWPSMAEAHACHRHVMILGKLYRTVADGSWSVPRRIEEMSAMRVSRQAL